MKKILIYAGLFMLPVFLIMGCTKNFTGINTNPAAYSKDNFDPNLMLTTVQLAYTGSTDLSYETWRANLIYCSDMIQGFSSVISYWVGDKYLFNPVYTAAYWGFGKNQGPPLDNGGDGAYPEQVKLVVQLVSLTKDNPKYKNLYNIARIMRALIFERITDLYGDCPYSEAGQGFISNNFTPKYDKQQDIYMDLLKELDDASSQLVQNDADSLLLGKSDALYNGNLEQWKRFGRTLLLRVAMRLSKVDPATAQTNIQKVIGLTMRSNDDNALVKADNAGARFTVNRNSQILTGLPEDTLVKWSNTFINQLKSTNDPRLGKIAVTLSGNPVQKGMPNGKDQSSTAGIGISTDPSYTHMGDYSSPSPAILKKDGPTFLLTYAESELLWAEAAATWSIGGDPAVHYRAGVEAAITYLSQYDASAAISLADADAYLAANPYNPANAKEMINTQYWIHTCTMLDFYEAWSNWRRSGKPVLTPVNYPGNSTNGQIPHRFPYPVTEASLNPQNYNQAHNNVPGGDNLMGRVWWDPQ